jgi:hypothetical protein
MQIKNKYICKELVFRIIALILLYLTSKSVLSQTTLINQGATIRTFSGSTTRVFGSVLNNTVGQIYVNGDGSTASSQWYITEDITNQSTITSDGHIHLNRHWINNGTFIYGLSTVFLEGGNQFLEGTTATTFFNLTLLGTGIKTQKINKSCANVLALNNLQLNTDLYTFFVLNPSFSAITRDISTVTAGFVSSANGGYLSRATNSTGGYLFPTGSTANNSANTPGTGTTRYRPVEIVPNSASASSYTVRLANLDASTTTENSGSGYNRTSKENTICTTNSLFFHQINRSSGTADADINVYYMPTLDGSWMGLARWNLPSVDNTWRVISGSTTANATSPFSVATKTAWNNFTANPYILFNGLIVSSNCGGPVCAGAASSLSSTVIPTGTYNFSWSSSPSGFNSNVQNPVISPNPLVSSSYTVVVSNTNDNCSGSSTCTLTVNQPPTINSLSPP